MTKPKQLGWGGGKDGKSGAFLALNNKEFNIEFAYLLFNVCLRVKLAQ